MSVHKGSTYLPADRDTYLSADEEYLPFTTKFTTTMIQYDVFRMESITIGLKMNVES